MAVVAAAMQGRYDAMIRAVADAQIEPVVIEDLVRIGEDIGLKKGIEQGIERGIERGTERGIEQGLAATRKMLLDVLELRGFEIPQPVRDQIEAERSLERLSGWHRAAMRAESIDAVFRD